MTQARSAGSSPRWASPSPRATEVELDYYNFEALNMAKDHPSWTCRRPSISRKTFQPAPGPTSPVQVRVMEKQQPPVRVIASRKVYRPATALIPDVPPDRGLYVDRKVTFGDLKGTLTYFLHHVFGSEVGVRFRPSFFPFTEPSAEVDIQCVMCRGAAGYAAKERLSDPGMRRWSTPRSSRPWGTTASSTGFAFGLGVERIAMLLGISDIRLFTENDRRFLEQF